MKLTDIELFVPTENISAVGKTILVGILEDGPIGKPFTLPEKNNPLQYLGETPTTRVAASLIEKGIPSENIFYYRLNGSPARVSFALAESPLFEIISVGANNRDNDAVCTVSAEGISIQSQYEAEEGLEELAYSNYKRSYRFEDYPYLSDLASAINQDAMLGLIDVIAREFQNNLSIDSFEIGQYKFSDASSASGYIHMNPEEQSNTEQVRAEYFELFAKHVLGEGFEGESFQPLMSIPAETICFPDVFADEMKDIVLLSSGIAKQKTEEQGIHCFVLFNTSPVPEVQELKEGDYLVGETEYWDSSSQETLPYLPNAKKDDHVLKLETLFSDEERAYHYMNHLIIVVGEELSIRQTPGVRSLLVNMLTADSSETLSNRELEGFRQLSSKLSKNHVARLSSNGYTCIVPSIRKGFVCQNVQNFSLQKDTVLSDIVNQRILGEIKAGLAYLLDNYIGKPFGFFTITKLENQLEDFLSQMSAGGRLDNYRMENVRQDVVNGEVSFSLQLSFPQSVQSVEGSIAIRKEGWELDVWNLNAE